MFIELTGCLKACQNIYTAQGWELLHGKLIPNKCGLQVFHAGQLFKCLSELRSVWLLESCPNSRRWGKQWPLTGWSFLPHGACLDRPAVASTQECMSDSFASPHPFPNLYTTVEWIRPKGKEKSSVDYTWPGSRSNWPLRLTDKWV